MLDLRKNCIWCKREFGPHMGKSKEHVFPESIGGSLTIPFLHKDCNEKLGQIDNYLYKDYWVNLAKKYLATLGVKGTKINPNIQYDGRLDKMIELHLPDGRKRLVLPKPEKETYRAIAKISFTVAAIGFGNLIFDPLFDDLKGFIEKGVPDLFGNYICQSYPNRNTQPRHEIIFKFDRPNLGISVVLFDFYVFTTFIRYDGEIKRPNFRIGQLLHPMKEAGIAVEVKKDKYKFVCSLDGKHIYDVPDLLTKFVQSYSASNS